MTNPQGGPGNPVLTSASMESVFDELMADADVRSTSFLAYPDADGLDEFQSIDILTAQNPKSLFAAQDPTAEPFPDSPNGSYQDSSSDSASCPRDRGSTSDKPGDPDSDAAMISNDKSTWDDFMSTDVDNEPDFGLDGHGRDTTFEALYGTDATYMNDHYGYEADSNSPDVSGTDLFGMASPGMPTIETDAPFRTEHVPQNSIIKNSRPVPPASTVSGHSPTSSINGVKSPNSREVTPASMIMSHKPSPSALADFQSPRQDSLGKETLELRPASSGPAPRPDNTENHQTGDWFGFPLHQGLPVSAEQMAMLQPSFNLAAPNPTPATPYRYEFKILPTPFKSRVETQIPIKMTLKPLPPGITKLHLPPHTISKPKLLSKPPPARSPDTLELHTTLVCVSAMENYELKKKALDRALTLPQRHLPPSEGEENSPQNGGDVRICNGCITRERKRASRKKNRKPEEDQLWEKDEQYRVIVFNTNEVKQWSPAAEQPGTAQIDAPMRIACYCRHHGEKHGFQVIFTLKDFQDNVVAQTISHPIMITDDHKTHHFASPSDQQSEVPVQGMMPVTAAPPLEATSLVSNLQQTNFGPNTSASDLTTLQSQPSFSSKTSARTTPTMSNARTLSRSASPTPREPNAKRRKGSGSRVPNSLAMTQLNTTTSSPIGPFTGQVSSSTSPFNTTMAQAESIFGQTGHTPFGTGPPTPNNEQPLFFGNNRSASMDNLAVAQLYSAPTSNHPSRAPSPNGLRNGSAVATQSQLNALSSHMYGMPLTMNPPQKPPTIHKVIPAEGTIMGGIEVTILGECFHQGLEIWFGTNKATTTTFWGESSLVCLLPPSTVVGDVLVHFKLPTPVTPQPFPLSRQSVFFKYIDDTEDKLIRHALAVLAQKMAGKYLEAGDLARRILQDAPSAGGGGGAPDGSSNGGQMYSHAPHAHLESQLLKVLDLIDLDDSQHRTRLDLKRSTGHTLLHMGCALGYHRFVAALLARGANPDAQDNGGFTPLHLAAIYNHHEIVRRLMLIGADATIRTLSGLTAADVARSRAVLKAVRRSERHIRRSRSSGGSLHSRTSSATSLRSLWEPMTALHPTAESLPADSSEESPEYTSGDLDYEDSEEESFLSMRRASGFGHERERPKIRAQESEQLDPVVALTLKEHLQQQFQQLQQQVQQAMAMQLPNFAQMQMPTLPGMPMFHDYQAYLPHAPFMRRVTQMMPGMGGNRPQQEAEWDPSAKDAQAAPPSYHSIYPADETKEASACLAAAEAEADIKCDTLYDQAQTSTAIATTKAEAPSVLKIGRKNAITKEQQEQFLRAKEAKMKSFSSDRNLFVIWIPLLIVMIFAGLYSYFPSLFTFAWAFIRSLYYNGLVKTQQLLQQDLPADVIPDRVVEV